MKIERKRRGECQSDRETERVEVWNSTDDTEVNPGLYSRVNYTLLQES